MINVEAMARGTPVVSFGVGGVSEYLLQSDDDAAAANNDNDNNDHDNNARGVVVEVPSMDQLLAAVSRLVDDASLRRRLGLAARAFVTEEKDMSNDRMARQYAVLYRNLVSSQRDSDSDSDRALATDVTPELSDRLAFRRRLNELVNRAGGGEKRGRSRIIELLREVAVLYGCPSPSSDDSELKPMMV